MIFLRHLAAAQSPETGPGPEPAKTSIVVTATRSTMETEKSPVSIGVVTRQELRVRGQQLLDQSLDLIEGVYANRGKGFQDTQSGVGMRGVSGRGSAQARTLILLDGQPLNDGYTGQLNRATVPIGEVDRVEVARGPFISLSGGNAMGGVINILTRPVTERALEITGQRGSQETNLYSARFSDRWLRRLGIAFGDQRLQSGGYATNGVFSPGAAGASGVPVSGAIPRLTTTGTRTFEVGDTGRNWWNQHVYRLRGDYTLNEHTVVTIQAILQRSGYGYDSPHCYVRDPQGTPACSGPVVFPFEGGLRRLTLTPFQFLAGDGGAVANLFNAKLYRTLSPRMRLRAGFGSNDQPQSYFATPATSAAAPSLISDRPARSYFGDFQWNWYASSRHALVAGMDLRKDSAGLREFFVPNYTRRAIGRQQSDAADGQSLNRALYAQDSWRLTERLLLVAGARYDYWRTYGGANNSFGATNLPPRQYPARSDGALTTKLALNWQLPGAFNLRASAANAFRYPTVFDLYRTWRSSAGTLFVSNPGLQPERMKSWETGVRRCFAGRVGLDAAYFENRISDLIYRVTDFAADPTGATRPVTNAAEALTRGFEFGAAERWRSALIFKQTYTHTNATIVKNPLLANTAGKRIPNVPANVASFGILATKAGNGGGAPAMIVNDLRRRGRESVEGLQTFLAEELHARSWNPKWISEMKAGGYAGAREMMDNLENLYGWQMTSPEQMDSAFWQNSYDVYVADKHGLALEQFFERARPTCGR